jgi:hypothetical protein
VQTPVQRWPGLLKCGCPSEFPALPAPLDELLRIRLPGAWGEVDAWVRRHGIEIALAEPAAWGIGVGADPAGEPAAAFLIHPGSALSARVPEHFESGGRHFRTIAHAFAGPSRMAMGESVKPPYSGARSGSFVSNDPNGLFIVNGSVGGWSGGTLSGIFRSPSGHKLRGLTNAHVALGAGFDDLIRRLPRSLRDLVASPKGRFVYAWDDHEDPTSLAYSGYGPGNPYVLFQVDTDTRILTPIPYVPGMSPVIAALMPIFLYTDVAAGDALTSAPPGFSGTPPTPVARHTIRGALLGGGQVAIPGDRVYKTGTASGTTWGTTLVSSAFILLPIPPLIPLLPPQMMVFNLDFHTTIEQPGDSGSLAVRLHDQAPLTVCGLSAGSSISAGTPCWLAEQFCDTAI